MSANNCSWAFRWKIFETTLDINLENLCRYIVIQYVDINKSVH